MKTKFTMALVTLCVGIFVLLFWSCQEKLDVHPTQYVAADYPKQAGTRLAFPNSRAFFATLIKLDRMTEDQLSQWSKKFNFNSLEESKDSVTADSISLKRYPRSHQLVLNANGEVLLGDTIVWYTGAGMKYFIPELNETELQRIKDGGKSILAPAMVTFKTIERKHTSNKAAHMIFSGPPDARYQYEFLYLNQSGSARKYVDEIAQTWDNDYSVLFFRVKLEWYSNSYHQWTSNAGEMRFIQLNVNYNCFLVGGSPGSPGCSSCGYLTFQGTFNNSYTQNHDVVLTIGSDYLSNGTQQQWDVDISGSIYQYITTDNPYHEYNPSGYPLW